MRAFRSPTLTSLHTGLINRLVTTYEFDLKTGSDYQWHNVIASSDSMEYKADLKHYWVDEKRWNRLIREYINPESVEIWAEACTKVKNRVAILRLGDGVKSHTNRGAKWRVWGACLLELAYREKPYPQLTLVSRTSYLGYLSVLDLAVPLVLSQYLPVKDCSFTWHVMAAQMSWMKALGYLTHWYPDAILEGEGELTPVLKRARTQMAKLQQLDADGKHYGEMLYNPERRLRRRYHTEVLGYDYAQQWVGSRETIKSNETYYYGAFKPLPSHSVNDLSLDALDWS